MVQSSDSVNDNPETERSLLIRAQREDPELGNLVKMKLDEDACLLSAERLQTKSELAKRLALRWDSLKVQSELVYRRKQSPRDEEPDFLQLLLPRSQVQSMLEECHGGTVSGHFGLQKTKDQVARRFYWNRWKTDGKRFCRRCPQCTSYHRGKLLKQKPLKPVLPGAQFKRWYIDLTDPHPRSDRGNL